MPGGVRRGVLGYGESCRAFVFNFLNVALYGNYTNPSDYNSYQIVLYEGTNIIDVYVKHRNCCATTNDHTNENPPKYYKEGIIGLQNRTSSQILFAPGREMVTDGPGWCANEEAWRFTPITPLDEQGELTWYINDTNSMPYSHDKVILVNNPTETVTKYISVYKFTNASGSTYLLMDTTTVLCPHCGDPTEVAVHEDDFIVYPNPTRNVVYVKMRNPMDKPSSIKVMDFNGKLLFAVPAYEITKVDLSGLPAGIYFLDIYDRQKKMVKVVKQ